MKNIQSFHLHHPQSNTKNAYHQVEIHKQNNISQLSVEKMKNMMIDNIIKKSKSSAVLPPFMLSSTNCKLFANQKSVVQDKKSGKKHKQSHKSPKKSPQKSTSIQVAKIKSLGSFELLDVQQKRRRIYGMPYLLQSQQNLPEQINYIAIPQVSQELVIYQSPRNYSETISTACSNKQKNGLKINDFQMGKISGMGKFGHVYLARHKKSGFICALKQIRKQGLDQILETQLIRQIKIQMFLNHPNIVKLYTFFSDQSHIYLVLEPCCSGQLYSFLKKHQPVNQDLAKVIIRQICQGIDQIHENHIIHRDLKPENILYHNSMMKICDFGWSIATPLMRETFCGTPLYVSPELLKRNSYNNKVDIWSLGILAFEILIGQVPFQIFCEADYIKIIKNEVKFPKFITISPEARDFIKCCLEKDPYRRPSSRELLEHPFIRKVEIVNFSQID